MNELVLGHRGLLTSTCRVGGEARVAIAPAPTFRAAPAPAPVLLHVQPQQLPAWGGAWITLTGAFFGHDSQSFEAFVGGARCPRCWRRSLSVAVCLSPQRDVDGGAPLQVEVRVDGVSSSTPGPQHAAAQSHVRSWPRAREHLHNTSAAMVQLQAMVVHSVRPNSGPTTGGTIVRVKGAGFGSKDSDMTVRIGGRRCLLTTWLSESVLHCVAPPGSGTQLDVVVTAGNMTSALARADNALFTYERPQLTRVLPEHGPTRGNYSVLVRGRNFGPREARVVVTLDGVPCAATRRLNHSAALCWPPPGVGRNHAVAIAVQHVLPQVQHAVASSYSEVSPAVAFSYDGACTPPPLPQHEMRPTVTLH